MGRWCWRGPRFQKIWVRLFPLRNKTAHNYLSGRENNSSHYRNSIHVMEVIMCQKLAEVLQRRKQQLTHTCTGEAAMSIPATKPPKTRPSDPARDTLNPPLLLRLPLLSESKKEPDSEIISNRPCRRKRSLR